MVALICLLEDKICILSTKSGSEANFVDALEVFGKEINLILSLMKYLPSKILVLRTVTVCCI